MMGLSRRTTRSAIEDELYEAEMALTDPEVRRSPIRVEELLHPRFSETGSSGEMYDRDRMIEMMTTETPGEVIIRDFSAERISEEIVLVTYRSVGMSGQEARRSSVWIRSDDRWQLRHHQGTRVPDRWGRIR